MYMHVKQLSLVDVACTAQLHTKTPNFAQYVCMFRVAGTILNNDYFSIKHSQIEPLIEAIYCLWGTNLQYCSFFFFFRFVLHKW
jgi:hypothetical protein